MLFLTEIFTDDAVRRLVGAQTFQRAVGYARGGRVLSLDVDAEFGSFDALVLGSRGDAYRTTVTVEPEDGSGAVWVDSYCTCPVGYQCKHAAAVMLVGRDQLSSAGAVAVPPWEEALAPIVQGPAQAGTPLALRLEVVTPRPSPYAGPAAAQTRVAIRPLMQGRKGGWIKTGISWQRLRIADHASGYREDQRTALAGLLAVLVPNGISPYTADDDRLYLDRFGPAVWPALRRVIDAGVALVPGDEGGTVSMAPAAHVSVDISRQPDGDALVRPRVTIADDPVEPLLYLGSPPHGVAIRDGQGQGLVLAPLEEPLQPAVASLVRPDSELAIPGAEVDRFLTDYYPRLSRLVDVESADGSVSLPEVAPPRLAATLTYSGQDVDVAWEVEYRYGEATRRFPISAADTDGGRDLVAEKSLIERVAIPDPLLPLLTWDAASGRTLVPESTVHGMDAVRLVDAALPAWEADDEVVVEEVGDRPDFREAATDPVVHVGARDNDDDPDWFDLGVSVWVDGEEVPFAELFAALSRGQTYLVLASGTWTRIDRPELHQLRELIEEARALQESARGPLRLSVYQAGLWEELCTLGVVAEQSKRWKDAVEGLLHVDRTDPPPVPAGVEAALRPYQVDGYRWMSFLWRHGLGGILADDMGLGKTLQSLAAICRAKDDGELSAPALVVAPASVVPGWVREAGRFTPGLNVVSLRETAAKRGTTLAEAVAGADVVITSYTLFRMEFDSYDTLPWSALLLDEAQFVKNHQGKTHQCVRRLGAPVKLALTGTPLENNLMDLWALMSVVAPGLFPNPDRFGEHFRQPIERRTAPERLDVLRRRVRPLMMRRTKEEVAKELPAKQEQVVDVTLGARHRRIYDTHLQRERQKILGLVDDMDRNRFTILKSLTLLRQLSLDASLVDDEYATVRSAKLDVLLAHLVQAAAEGHRALVFSQFTRYLRKVRDRLDAEGIGYCYLDGRTRNRSKAINAFKDGDAPVFLISLKAGGFGLNLTEADYCFVLDPWWNPATEQQAVDRAHRIGQDKTVVVYRLVSSDTIEQKVMALKERKKALFDTVMGDDGALSGPLTATDIEGLLATG